jgi:hypothetical protein
MSLDLSLNPVVLDLCTLHFETLNANFSGNIGKVIDLTIGLFDSIEDKTALTFMNVFMIRSIVTNVSGKLILKQAKVMTHGTLSAKQFVNLLYFNNPSAPMGSWVDSLSALTAPNFNTIQIGEVELPSSLLNSALLADSRNALTAMTPNTIYRNCLVKYV